MKVVVFKVMASENFHYEFIMVSHFRMYSKYSCKLVRVTGHGLRTMSNDFFSNVFKCSLLVVSFVVFFYVKKVFITHFCIFNLSFIIQHFIGYENIIVLLLLE